MLKTRILLLLIIPLLFGSASKPSGVKFHKGSFTGAKTAAASEGKLFMVDFTAKWCLPCRWMEETTFSNPEVIKYIDKHYVAAKVDIDDFDGFAYKQIYGIKALPSILIFNSKGEKVAQYQESMSPSKLLAVLKQHNIAANRVHSTTNQSGLITPKPSAIQPQHPEKYSLSRLKPHVSKPSRPKVKKQTSTPRPNLNSTLPAKPFKKEKTNPAPFRSEVMGEEGLFRFSVTRQVSQGFSVQIGAFGEYGNVLREVEKLEHRFNEPVLVHISKLKGKPVYKVMIGNFSDRNEASGFKQIVANSGIPAMVKDLATIK